MDGHYINPTKKANENEEWRLTQWQFGSADNTLKNRFWAQIGTHDRIRESKTVGLCAFISLSTANHVHKRILAFTIWVQNWLNLRNDFAAHLLKGSPNALHSFSLHWIKAEDKRGNRGCDSLYHSFVKLQFSFLNNFIWLNEKVCCPYFYFFFGTHSFLEGRR